jgi:hypothetical protein
MFILIDYTMTELSFQTSRMKPETETLKVISSNSSLAGKTIGSTVLAPL